MLLRLHVLLLNSSKHSHGEAHNGGGHLDYEFVGCTRGTTATYGMGSGATPVTANTSACSEKTYKNCANDSFDP